MTRRPDAAASRETRMMSTKVDSQLIGAAGEFLTAGKLFKRGLQVAVTYGNAKSIDLFVSNRSTGRTFVVQVKTQHKKNCFPVKPSAIDKDHTYVFVRLNGLSDAEEFFIVPGHEIIAKPDKFFGSSVRKPTRIMPAINYGPLTPYRDNWQVFDEDPADHTGIAAESPNKAMEPTGLSVPVRREHPCAGGSSPER